MKKASHPARHANDGTLNEVARSIGSTLGTVVATVKRARKLATGSSPVRKIRKAAAPKRVRRAIRKVVAPRARKARRAARK
jgi:hypothetical protein